MQRRPFGLLQERRKAEKIREELERKLEAKDKEMQELAMRHVEVSSGVYV